MSILSPIIQHCQASPDNIAFIENERQLSYAELDLQTQRISSILLNHGAPGLRIIIALDRGIDAAICILSVLRAACCYIPIDLKNPKQRLNYITQDADPQLVIGKGHCPDWIDNPSIWLDLDSLPTTTVIKTPDHTSPSIAAILYTSGSSGNPKGVALSDSAMTNFANWAANTFSIQANDRFASLAPFHFDLSVFDLFTSLSCGATVNFIPNQLTLSPSRLTAWLSEHQISVWYTVPSILSFIAHKGALDTTPLPALKTILFAGEVFPTPQLIKICQLLDSVNFYNLYGPTETNVCCYWPVDRNRLKIDQAIPIGLPACNSILKIDETSHELTVKSLNNFSGYWQQGALTPHKSADDYYYTGDKVSINEWGEYYYHGRLDRMIKCSGYRVEPAEIEKVISLSPDIINCAVLGIKDISSGQRPVAILVLTENANLAEITKAIKQRLPSYMHPCKFLVLNALPYLANGKTDYQTLAKQLENK